MALNNEVSILNIANIDNDIKDASTRSMIAGEEVMEYATHNYDVNQYFIWNDRKLYKTTQRISVGSNFVVDVNVKKVGDICSQLYDLYSQSPETIRDIISNVEDTNNSSRAYYVGEYVIRNDGFLYRVILNISYGTLWRVGTNIEKVDNITSLVNDLESKSRLLAFIEPGFYASRQYIDREQFIFQNQLVRAITTIEKGSAITLNGNCEAVGSITQQLESRPNVVESGRIYAQSMKTFVLKDYYLYRLTLMSIGGARTGKIVLAGKHPSVSQVAFCEFEPINPASSSLPIISANGSVLSVQTVSSSDIFYVLENLPW